MIRYSYFELISLFVIGFICVSCEESAFWQDSLREEVREVPQDYRPLLKVGKKWQWTSLDHPTFIKEYEVVSDTIISGQTWYNITISTMNNGREKIDGVLMMEDNMKVFFFDHLFTYDFGLSEGEEYCYDNCKVKLIQRFEQDVNGITRRCYEFERSEKLGSEIDRDSFRIIEGIGDPHHPIGMFGDDLYRLDSCIEDGKVIYSCP